VTNAVFLLVVICCLICSFYGSEFRQRSREITVSIAELGIVFVFMPLNFAVLLFLRNSRNKGFVNTKGFTIVNG